LSVAIAASFTNVSVGFPVQLTALIEGRTAASVWDFFLDIRLSVKK